MTPYYQDEAVTIYHGDCLEILPTLEADVVVTDPPYGTGGWRRLESGAGRNPSAQLVHEAWDNGAVDWLPSSGTPVLTFWTSAKSLELLLAARDAGLSKYRLLVMRKRDPKPQPAGRIRWSIEPVWVLSREGFLLLGGTDWFEASTPRMGRDIDAVDHPYQKPLEVMRWIVGKTSGSVVDPFMGSGTTLRATKDLGRKAIGIEIEEKYCEIAAKRMGQEVLALG